MAKESVDLLSSIQQPKTVWEKIFDWIFSVGRYLVVFVEALVLIAFISRFGMDRVRNDLDKKITSSVRTLEFYEETGKTDTVITSYYIQEGAQTLIENQHKYSILLNDINDIFDGKASVASLSVQEDTVNITASTASVDELKVIEDAFRESSFFSNVSVDLNVRSGQNDIGVSFGITAVISPDRYVGNFISAQDPQQ